MIRAGRPRSPCLKISMGNRFSVPHWVQNDSRVLLLSYAMGTRGSLSGGQVAGREADHSLPFIAETNNAWSYTSTLSYIFIAAVNIGNIVLEPLSKWSHSFGIPDHIFPPTCSHACYIPRQSHPPKTSYSIFDKEYNLWTSLRNKVIQ
jgi:hypothetical protein